MLSDTVFTDLNLISNFFFSILGRVFVLITTSILIFSFSLWVLSWVVKFLRRFINNG